MWDQNFLTLNDRWRVSKALDEPVLLVDPIEVGRAVKLDRLVLRNQLYRLHPHSDLEDRDNHHREDEVADDQHEEYRDQSPEEDRSRVVQVEVGALAGLAHDWICDEMCENQNLLCV